MLGKRNEEIKRKAKEYAMGYYTKPPFENDYDILEKAKVCAKTMNNGLKYDLGKTRWDLLPLDVLEGVAKVLTFGADKYEDNSWQGVETNRYYAAMMRHFKALQDGEELDNESGLHHAYHFACNAIFIAWQITNKEEDND